VTSRLIFLLITTFWVIMNILLWRSEFSKSGQIGSTIPVETVWQKILTAPDDSSLEILQKGKRIGRCRWVANVAEPLSAAKLLDDEGVPEGMIKDPAGYTIDVDGNLALDTPPLRLRLNVHGGFSTNHQWREFVLRAALRPETWEVRANAARQTVALKFDGGEEKWERSFTFADLQDPKRLLREFGGAAFLAPWLAGSTLPANPKLFALGLNWRAQNDWLKIGHAQVRTYRLEAQLLDRYRAVVHVSRVGELLRVELPEDIVLVNEALSF
jgi:hypothetical protein